MATPDSTSNPRQLSFADGYQIPLTQGQVAVVDLEDADLAHFKWFANMGREGSSHYAMRREHEKAVHMHRVILERKLGRMLEDCEFVDHIDLDTLNNHRANLRLATAAENGRNRGKNKNNTSGFKGVTLHRPSQKWIAHIRVQRKQAFLGYFDTPEAAHAAYCKAAEELHGEFRRTE